MKKKSRHVYNPLSSRHFQQVICMKTLDKQALRDVYGVTWNLKGARIAPIDKVAAMVMVACPNHAPNKKGEASGDILETICVRARVDPQFATVHLEDVRMAHDFGRNPKVGAAGRTMNPAERNEDRFGNADWVRLALGLHKAMHTAATRNWKLGTRPQMPELLVSYDSPGALIMRLTPELEYDAEQAEKTPEEVFKAAWREPHSDNNPTGSYLIPLDYVETLSPLARVYGDWTQIQGVDIHNVVSDISTIEIQNPAYEIADEMEMDLRLFIENSMSDDDEVRADAQDQLLALRDILVQQLNERGAQVDREQAYHLVVNPDDNVTVPVTNLLEELGKEEAISVARAMVQKKIPNHDCDITDDDLYLALQYPEAPLRASLLAMPQVMFRDQRIAPIELFQYHDSSRLFVDIWGPRVQMNHEDYKKWSNSERKDKITWMPG